MWQTSLSSYSIARTNGGSLVVSYPADLCYPELWAPKLHLSILSRIITAENMITPEGFTVIGSGQGVISSWPYHSTLNGPAISYQPFPGHRSHRRAHLVQPNNIAWGYEGIWNRQVRDLCSLLTVSLAEMCGLCHRANKHKWVTQWWVEQIGIAVMRLYPGTARSGIGLLLGLSRTTAVCKQYREPAQVGTIYSTLSKPGRLVTRLSTTSCCELNVLLSTVCFRALVMFGTSAICVLRPVYNADPMYRMESVIFWPVLSAAYLGMTSIWSWVRRQRLPTTTIQNSLEPQFRSISPMITA